MSSTLRTAFLAGVAVAMITSLALAQERKAGDRIAYDVQMGAQGAMAMTIAIESIDPDGTSHGTLSLTMPQTAQMPGIKPATFGATISPAGAIASTPNPNLKPHVGMSDAETMAIALNQMALSLQTALRMSNFNTFAMTCAARTLHVGDAWQAPMEGSVPVEIRYTVSGRERQLDHDTFVVNMQSAPNPKGSMTGQGYYDPSAHLVVKIHSEYTTAGGGGSFDVALHPQ